jgi:hypothetical protein
MRGDSGIACVLFLFTPYCGPRSARSRNMMDASQAIDAYLIARFGISLERVLADATAGVVSLAIAGSVKVACDPVGL